MLNPSSQPQGQQEPATVGYEKRDASAKGIFAAAGGLFVVLIIAEFIIIWIYSDFKKSSGPKDRFTGAVRQHAVNTSYPQLQLSPQADLKEFRDREEAELNTYGWINRTAGVVRIPIDKAMDLVLQQGLPTRKPGTQGKPGASNYELQQQRNEARQPEIGGSQ
jgi:hypothetical protein